jgi:hypothetical protein
MAKQQKTFQKMELPREVEVAGQLAKAWGCSLFALDPGYRVSHAMTKMVDDGDTKRRAIKGFIEMQERECKSEDFKHAILPAAKVWGMRNVAAVTALPVLLLIRFSDKLMWVNVDKAVVEFDVGAPDGVAGAQETELYAYVPLKDFKVVG